MNNWLEPFDPAKHKPQDMGLGGMSTEYTASAPTPSGWVNYPSIWFDQSGRAHMLEGDAAYDQAMAYEKATGRAFPRFENEQIAAEMAQHRSAMGGGKRGLLSK